MHINRSGLVGLVCGGAVMALLIVGPAAQSATPTGAAPAPAAIDYAFDPQANDAAWAAVDRLAATYGLTDSSLTAGTDPNYFETSVTSQGLEASTTQAPSDAQLAAWRHTASPVPLTVRVVGHSMKELTDVAAVVTEKSEAIRALGVEPVKWGPDYASDSVVVTVREPFTPDVQAQIRQLVGPLVTLDYGSTMCGGSGPLMES